MLTVQLEQALVPSQDKSSEGTAQSAVSEEFLVHPRVGNEAQLNWVINQYVQQLFVLGEY